ncbi:MAG: hypothetical protein K9W44_15775 [Candidatus Lokiarchaeota archaeon]|nr:hypothetical protein [Candidatus Harpocratesius repetitus]
MIKSLPSIKIPSFYSDRILLTVAEKKESASNFTGLKRMIVIDIQIKDQIEIIFLFFI